MHQLMSKSVLVTRIIRISTLPFASFLISWASIGCHAFIHIHVLISNHDSLAQDLLT